MGLGPKKSREKPARSTRRSREAAQDPIPAPIKKSRQRKLPADPVKVSNDHSYFWSEKEPAEPALSLDNLETAPEEISDKDKIRLLEEKVAKLEEENCTLKRRLSGAEKLFCPEQLDLLCGYIKRVKKWPDHVIQQSIHKYFYCGTKGYQLLRDQGYPLPAIDTIVKRLQKFQYLPGTLAENFQLLSHQSNFMEPEDKYATLIQDEASIQPRIEYNPSTKSITGYVTIPPNTITTEYDRIASKVLCFILGGINRRWKILVAYAFTGSSFQVQPTIEMIREIVSMANQIGIKIVGLPSDLGFRNV